MRDALGEYAAAAEAGSSTAAAERITILYLIDELCGVGGAENALFRIVRHLPRPRYRPLVATFRCDAAAAGLDALSAPLYVFPLRRTYGPEAFRVARSLRRLIREENVRITHSFFETSDLWGGAVAKWSGCSVLVSSRRDMGILRTWKHQLAYRAMRRMYDQVQTVSESVRRMTIDRDRLPEDRVVTVYTGVDVAPPAAPLSRAELRGRLEIPVSSPVIITVANLRPVKGIDVLLRAAAVVMEKRADAIWVIVGSSPDAAYAERMRSLASALGIADRVRFWGTARDVGSLLAAADVFALLSDNEGFSNAVVEAMAAGLPCVVTDVGGNAEAVPDGECGHVVGRGDASGAAQHILELLDDPAARRRMGEAARARAGRHFTTDAMIRRLTDCYESLLRQAAR